MGKCMVKDCFYAQSKNGMTGVRKFSFPLKTKEKWCEILGLDIASINEYSKVCIHHFTPDDFFIHGTCHKLKPGRVPKPHLGPKYANDMLSNILQEKNPLETTETSMEPDINIDPFEDLSPIDVMSELATIGGMEGIEGNFESDCSSSDNEETVNHTTLQASASSHDETGNCETTNTKTLEMLQRGEIPYETAKRLKISKREYQLLCGCTKKKQLLPVFIENFVNNDAKIKYYTGMQTYDKFYHLYDYVFEEWPSKRPKVLSPLNEFFVTIIRLRHGYEYELLSDLFGSQNGTLARYFQHWTDLLYKKLTTLNIFPNRELLVYSASAHFIAKWPKAVGSILYLQFDVSCSRLQKEFNLESNRNQMKALLMINPQGTVVYISKLFLEPKTDKEILDESNFLTVLKEKVEKGELEGDDVLLTHEGPAVKIKKLLDNSTTTLDLMTFNLSNGQQIEMDSGKEAQLRLAHVLMAVKRIKDFKFLTKDIAHKVVTNLSKYLTICAYLTLFTSFQKE